MNPETPHSDIGPAAVFDLTQPSARIWPTIRRMRRVAIGVAVFLVLIGMVLAVTTRWGAYFTGSLSAYNTIDVSVILLMVVVGVGALGWDASKRAPSAITLRVSDAGFELTYPRGRHVTKLWSDPNLKFELSDFSHIESSLLAVPEFPYSLRLRGRESSLTRDAFEAMTAQVQHHQLANETASGSRWLYTGGGRPRIQRVRVRGQ